MKYFMQVAIYVFLNGFIMYESQFNMPFNTLILRVFKNISAGRSFF